MSSRASLPEFTRCYLDEAHKGTTHDRVVVMFHHWVETQGLPYTELLASDVGRFIDERQLQHLTKASYRAAVKRYLLWLSAKGLAGPFRAADFEAYHRRPVPDEVLKFLRFLTPMRRPSTVKLYLSVLRRFHEWLREEQGIVDVAGVTRAVCLEWSQHLHDLGHHSATRVGELVCVRCYFDFLWEAGSVPIAGRELIRSSDLPKKPEYLPRPLPPDSDATLQERLKASTSKIGMGLYVMRRAGLRVGELRQLERDCVRVDPSGTHFLKVPLGKMNSERLVPLDPAALAMVNKLQSLQEGATGPFLVEGAREGHPAAIQTYTAELKRLTGDLELTEPMTTHRLRHSFASSLMSGGMSLGGIMKLLGHRDLRMTLRYTRISDETVGREYFEALSRVAERYDVLAGRLDPLPSADPIELLEDLHRWLTKHLVHSHLERPARLLLRRLEALRDDLRPLIEEVQAGQARHS